MAKRNANAKNEKWDNMYCNPQHMQMWGAGKLVAGLLLLSSREALNYLPVSAWTLVGLFVVLMGIKKLMWSMNM